MDPKSAKENINGMNIYMILAQEGKTEEDLSLDYIERSLERDKLLIRAIQTGNKELLAEVGRIKGLEVNNKNYYANPIIEGDPLRTRKNGMIIRNTLGRIAAAFGGVPAIYLHLVSEKYALQIEQATSPEYLDNVVSPRMFDEYCDLVTNFSASKYSSLIKEIVIYIGSHLREELSVSMLADHFHVNAAHLARKFKKETGYTISEYVNHQKIEAAKLLFQGGEASVSEVAARLGFNSSSYFSKTFKKITGLSPAYYMQEVNEGNVEPVV